MQGTSLAAALGEIRAAAGAADFPLALSTAGQARESASSLVTRLDDYLIPRLRRLDAPALAVVGGSTGAGKSTLVNSLVRAPVSAAGVLRPTTRAPLLICHPADATWFGERALLPGLPRTTRPGADVLQVINAPLLSPGLALLDAPDIDSVVNHNRSLAHQLLAAADLWLFVTTAARYADAVPWRVLHEAREQGTALAVVLNRVPPDVTELISGHLARMLSGHGLDEVPMFTISESTLDGHGLLAEVDTAPIKRWLDRVARSGAGRRQMTRRSLIGAVTTVGPQVEALADAAEQQLTAASGLTSAVRAAYQAATTYLEASLRGALLHGDLYAHWSELVASGELRTALKVTAGGGRRSRVPSRLANQPIPGRRFHAAAAAAIAGLIEEADLAATLGCRERWRADPAGRALLAADPALGRPWPGFVDAAHNLVNEWQTWLRSTVRDEPPRPRPRTRTYADAATVLVATIAVVAPPAPDLAGSGPGSTGLRSVLTSRPARALGDLARAELIDRAKSLLGVEIDRHLAAVVAAAVDPQLPRRLRAAADRVRASPVDVEWGEAP